jgi:tetratricopeptide (TPR) repeat protein
MPRNRPEAAQSPISTLGRFLLLALVLALPIQALAQTTADDKAEKQRAYQLYDQSKFAEALPILEKLVSVNPSDVGLLERLGWATFVVSGSIKNPEARKKERDRARGFLTRARDLGDNSELLRAGLEALSQPDDTDESFSPIREADAAMREGEEAHSRGELDKAIKGYQRALELDPKLYLAALFIGDMYFKKGVQATDLAEKKQMMTAAGEWFSRAIAIDENVETAYRYWGDALDAQGRSDEARDRFVEAIIAEPYDRKAYVGLTQWGGRHKVVLGHPKINIPTNVTSNKPGEINITVDELALKGSDDDGSAAWMMYGIVRAAWMDRKDGGRSEKFARAYPNESAYRHSLAEEVDALRGVLESVQVQAKEKRVKKLTPSLENLMKLNEAGLIEAYILFVRPDEGIGRDYVAYRKSNREKLKQYWLEFVVGTR